MDLYVHSAAMPSLFYADAVHPYRRRYASLAVYFERLAVRPASQRVIREAQSWFQYFPFVDFIEPRFLAAA